MGLLIVNLNQINAQTTIMSGDFSNPTTWGGVPPTGSGTVIINHTVNLDIDYAHSSGSITIGASGALTSNNPMRFIAINYPSGNASLTVNGTLNVSRIALFGGDIVNNGSVVADSLLANAIITNNVNANINAAQFMIAADGKLTNKGQIDAINLLNADTVINYGNINSNDFCNSKTFLNENNAVINIAHDFSNVDTITSPAILTNNGQINVGNDWHNGSTIDGSGNWCVVNNTWNNGIMNGDFDFCDQSGGNIDLQEGTVASTITYCTSPCSVGVSELNISINIYPNPCYNKLYIKNGESFSNALILIYNSFGQIVYKNENLSGSSLSLDVKALSPGLYYISIIDETAVFKSSFIKD